MSRSPSSSNLRPGKLIRIRGQGRKLYRLLKVTASKGRVVLGCWGPVTAYDKPTTRCRYVDFDIDEWAGMARTKKVRSPAHVTNE